MRDDDIFKTGTEETGGLGIRDIIDRILSYWYWFVLSVLICLSVAYIYLKVTPQIYTRTATVLIKDNQNGGVTESAAFEELGTFGRKNNVDNEIFVFKSKRLMMEVVRRLNLNVGYTRKDWLKTSDLYGISPVEVIFSADVNEYPASFTVTPVSGTEFYLSAISSENTPPVKAHFGDTVTVSFGKIVVKCTPYYTETSNNLPIRVVKQKVDGVANAYKNMVNVALKSKSTSLIDLSLQDVCSKRAEDVINTLIDVYNEEVKNDKNRIAVNTADFIKKRLNIIGEELGDVDREIENYKKKNELTDIISETGIYLQNNNTYKNEGIEIENRIKLARFIRDYLTDDTKSDDLIPTNIVLTDGGIDEQIGIYNETLLKREKLIQNSSGKNPVIEDLNRSLKAIRRSIIRSVDNLLVSLEMKLKNLQEQEGVMKRRIASVPTQEKDILSVARQQKIKEELYLYLLNKREENALSLAITESNARIVDSAYGSNIPVTPKPSMIFLIAFALGCIIPAVIMYLREMLSTSIRGRKDIEDNISIPFLGEIPQKENSSENDVVVHENGRDGISEAFRIVRTNMDFMRMNESESKVIMFTSANPGAGKTFVATNLAMSFALTSKKVILLDTDIRKGALKRYVTSVKKGITNYLSGKVNTIDEIIIKGELHPNLDVIQAGPVPPNPAELLLNTRLEELITELRKRYDYIIIDNVPAMMVADAAIVNRVADITIYVVRQGIFDRRQLPELEKLYKNDKFRNMSVILNGVKKQNYRYGYGYGYNYGYSYGYGNEEVKKKHFFNK